MNKSAVTVHPGFGHCVVLWGLVGMALAVFALCVLWPEWRHHQSLRLAEQLQQHRVDSLRRQVERERRMLDALRADPGAIERLAQRELHYARSNERAVFVPVSPSVEDVGEPFVPQPVPLPPLLERVAARLPSWNYDAVFGDRPARTVLTVLSLALLVIALGVVGRVAKRAPIG